MAQEAFVARPTTRRVHNLVPSVGITCDQQSSRVRTGQVRASRSGCAIGRPRLADARASGRPLLGNRLAQRMPPGDEDVAEMLDGSKALEFVEPQPVETERSPDVVECTPESLEDRRIDRNVESTFERSWVCQNLRERTPVDRRCIAAPTRPVRSNGIREPPMSRTTG